LSEVTKDITLRELLAILAGMDDARMVEAERGFRAEIERHERIYRSVRASSAWGSVELPKRYFGPFQLAELVRMAEQVACEEAGSYESGLDSFYKAQP
jgi:hypothetical protein